MFLLTNEEFKNWLSQFAITNERFGLILISPYAE